MVFNYGLLGERLREIRKRRGLSQMSLAEATGLTSTFISYVENGHKTMRLETFVQIANALNVSADELLMDSLENTLKVRNNEFADVLADCNEYERRVLADILKATKESLRKNRPYGRSGR